MKNLLRQWTIGKKAYNFISSINSNPQNKKPILHKGRLVTDERKIANLFNVGYTTKKQIPKKWKKMKRKIKVKIKHNKQQSQILCSEIEIFSKNFNRTVLNHAINKLKNKSAPGADKIHTEFLKNLGPNHTPKIHICKKTIPAEWKKQL